MVMDTPDSRAPKRCFVSSWRELRLPTPGSPRAGPDGRGGQKKNSPSKFETTHKPTSPWSREQRAGVNPAETGSGNARRISDRRGKRIGRIRVVELGSVENVEEPGADFERHSLANTETWRWSRCR